MAKGLDMAFKAIGPNWVAARRAEGYTIFIQNAWTGGFASNADINAVCEHNIRTARQGGMIVEAYVNASPPSWWSIEIQMANIRANIGSEWANLRRIHMDVEIAGTTLERSMELAAHLKQQGARVDSIYTARWFAPQVGGFLDPRWKATFPLLWTADYDGDPTLDFPKPYGHWTLADLYGKQYQGTTNLDGINVDLNTIREEEEDDMALTERQAKALEELAKLTLDPYTTVSGKEFSSFMAFLKSKEDYEDAYRIDWMLGRK